jgi:excisionase family DNA binding protein
VSLRRRRRAFLRIDDLASHPEENLAPEQLAVWWNVDVQTIRKWVRVGSLEAYRLGRALRVRKAVALEFEDRGRLRAS